MGAEGYGRKAIEFRLMAFVVRRAEACPKIPADRHRRESTLGTEQ